MPHTPVLRDELVDAVTTDRDGAYVDATFGRGGHSIALLQRLSSGARLLAIDRDADAVAAARALAQQDPRVTAAKGRFSELAEILKRHGMDSPVGVVFDVGVSSPQIDDPERGFSFMHTGPLDMRMDRESPVSAARFLNETDEAEMTRVFRSYGEERYARAIARAVIRNRPLTTTTEFAAVIDRAVPRRDPNKHAATRVFQAVRIHVNDELGELDRGMEAAFDQLAVRGRLAILSFHSLEHRLVRGRFRLWVKGDMPRRLPVRGDAASRARYVVRKRRPADAEIRENPRSRSALLQVVEKTRR